MIDSAIVGTITFIIILAVDKLVPDTTQWKKALFTAAVVTIAVSVWLAFKPA